MNKEEKFTIKLSENWLRNNKIERNMRILEEKSKEINKDIPQELYNAVLNNFPEESNFIKKYQEWITFQKEP